MEEQTIASPHAKKSADVLTVLHVGDVFLDGPVPRLRRDTKEHRREELREAFRAFMQRVDEEGADAVIFSGNLVDGRFAGDDTLRFLLSAFEERPDCHFVIAPGPFDPYNEESIYRTKRFPRNVHVFLEEVLSTYTFPDLPLTVYGWGYRSDKCAHAPLGGVHKGKSDRFTLLCGYTRLRSDDVEGAPMDASAIASFGAHYAALSGGVHDGFHRAENAVYAYSGSFEGRGDAIAKESHGGYIRIRARECEQGWTVEAARLPLDTYSYAAATLDVSHLSSAAEAEGRLLSLIREGGYGPKTVLRVTLQGSVPISASFDGLEGVSHGVYSLWVEDHTVPTDVGGALFEEMNARGELYRYFYPKMTEGTEQERVRAARAFRIGYAALCGEDFAKY